MQKSTFVPAEQIEKSLQSAPIQGVRLLEPFKTLALSNNLPFKVLEDSEIINKPEIHVHEGDLWYCLEGTVTFVVDGILDSPTNRNNADGSINNVEIVGESITGGTEITLKEGDWLWIPPGQPHQHLTKAYARLMIIKIPEKK